MAGSIGHVIHNGIYTGFSHLDNRRDDVEAIEEFAFVLLATTTEAQRKKALVQFRACCDGHEKFPAWWKPEFEPDGEHLPPQRRKNS